MVALIPSGTNKPPTSGGSSAATPAMMGSPVFAMETREMKSARSTIVPLQCLAWSPSGLIGSCFSRLLTTSAQDFLGFSHLLPDVLLILASSSLPQSIRTTGSTTATTGALTLFSRTFIILVLACLFASLSAASMDCLIRTKVPPLNGGFDMRSTSLCRPTQTVVTFSFTLSASVSLSLLVSLRLRLPIPVHPPRDAQEGSKSLNGGAHQVQPTIVCSIMPQIDLPTGPGGGLRTAVWASFPPDGVIHRTTSRANKSTSSKTCANGTNTFVLSFSDIAACVEAT